MCKSWRWWIVGAFLTGCTGAECLGELESPELILTGDMVELRWQLEPSVVLQRSATLAGPWITVEETRGEGNYETMRTPDGAYFRLKDDEPDGETSTTQRLEELETLLVGKVKERLRRSSLPPSERDDFSIDANGVSNRAVSQEPFAWVSQPGMIRTYGASPSFAEAFPLYSTSGAEVMTTVEELDQEFEKIRRWDQTPSRFVDLNAATVHGENRQFPILNDTFDRGKYPEGFRVTSPRPSSGGDFDAFPMPVEWIYVLADGSEGTLGPEGAYVGGGEVSADNPLVARYAYWTDDESTKINLNTASEGIPWETPTIQSPLDRAYAAFPPVTNEVQRYPGHPAKTCLSSLFYPNLYVDAQGELALPGEALADLYEIAPQITPVEPLPFEEASPVAFDEDPVYESLTDFHQRHPEKGTGYDGFLTTTSVAPETSVHGRPRASLWPLHVNMGEAYRSEYDESVSQRTTLSRRSYHVLRERSESAYHDFYTVGDRSNVALYRYLMDQVYRPLPAIGGSLAKKYGATADGFDALSGHRDHGLDHVRLTFQMLDFIRSTNLIDGRLEVPFAAKNAITGSGQVTPLSMLSQDLNSGDGRSEHAEKIFSAYAEPKGHGRDLTISEVSLVLYVTAEATLRGFDADGDAMLSSTTGPPDWEIIGRVLSNEHPNHDAFYGRKFDETDVGKRFGHLEVGLIVEGFSVSQGYPHIQPRKSVRLLTSGSDYLGGVDREMGIKVNGVPLELWGNSVQGSQDMIGPMLMTVAPELPLEDRFPAGWSGIGGTAGARLFRYGQFEIKETSPGYYGDLWLANTRGPLSVAYCQSPVIVEMGKPLILTQEQPLQLVVYNGVGAETTREHIQQIYHLRYVEPDEALTLLPPRRNSHEYSGWTRRFEDGGGRFPVFYLESFDDRELVKSLVVSHSDYRLVSGRRLVPSEMFMPHPDAEVAHASHSLSWDIFDRASSVGIGRGTSYSSMRDGIKISDHLKPDYNSDASNRAAFAPLLSENYQFAIDPSVTRDVETGFPSRPDGAYIRMPDEGGFNLGGRHAYFDQVGPEMRQVSSAHFSPHRQVTSPIAFGALPSASQAQVPWTSLLFRPHLALDQSSQEGQHLGQRGNGLRFEEEVQSLEGFAIPKFSSVRADASLPADHHWLDLFWMPPAAPVRVSGPFATAGKVNMNYEMMPFRHIKRATALHALLKSERLLAIPNWAGRTYKDEGNEFSWRHRIDATETLRSFEEKFQRGELFLTESEICEHHLFPEGIPWDVEGRGIRQFWDAHRLSGDDVLERPYANVHARLTTRSNAFKLHFRIEVLEKSTETPVDSFVEGVDKVTGVKTGAQRLIRQLDGNDPRIPDYLGDRDHQKPRLEHFYRFKE